MDTDCLPVLEGDVETMLDYPLLRDILISKNIMCTLFTYSMFLNYFEILYHVPFPLIFCPRFLAAFV